jgi:hypothetical protein
MIVASVNVNRSPSYVKVSLSSLPIHYEATIIFIQELPKYVPSFLGWNLHTYSSLDPVRTAIATHSSITNIRHVQTPNRNLLNNVLLVNFYQEPPKTDNISTLFHFLATFPPTLVVVEEVHEERKVLAHEPGQSSCR